ncbi:MAG TPA: acyltransferase [bacterium]|nr:acyltransferase [bacterium]
MARVRSPLTPEAPLRSIDLARTFCIYLVVQKHLILSGLVAKPLHDWAAWFFLRLCENGIYGVYLFFVISGFLITRLADRMPGGLFAFDFRAFYVRRAARILPLFFLAAGLGGLLWALLPPGQAPSVFCFNLPPAKDPFFWGSLATFSFNWYALSHPPVYFSLGFHWILLWSLSVEEQFYLFYPLILRGLKNTRNLKWFLAALVASGPIFRAAGETLWPDQILVLSIGTPAVWDLLAAGALIYLVSGPVERRLKQNPAWAWGGLLAGLLTLGALCLGTHCEDRADLLFTPTLLALGLGLFLWGAFSIPAFEKRSFGILLLPGRWSYGIYLLHVVVLFVLWSWLKGRPLWECGLLLGAALLAVAGLSNRFYEKPLNQWVRRFAEGKARKSP